MSFDFLRLQDPVTPFAILTLNVVHGTWVEDPVDFRGVRRRAFDGSWLSTRRTPKRNFSCTVEFLTPAALEAFLDFLALDTAQPYLGAREVNLLLPAGNYTHQWPLRSRTSFTGGSNRVLVEIGRMTAREEERSVAGNPTGTITSIVTWQVDITLSQT